MMNPIPQLVGLGGMARRLGVSTKWLRAEAVAGHLPHLKAGERFLFVPEVVISILAERAAQTTPNSEGTTT